MLFKNKSKKSVLSRFLILIPVMVVVIAFQSKETEIMDIDPANFTKDSPELSNPSAESLVPSLQEERAIPKEGWEEFLQGIANRYEFPKAAEAAKVKGKVIVRFVIETDGSLTDIKIVQDLGHGTGEETVRVLKSSPKWNPARKDGKPVRSNFTLPILLDYGAKAAVEVKPGGDVPPPPPMNPAPPPPPPARPVEVTPVDDQHLFTEVEIQPLPPGGMQAFLQYIGENYVYPKEAEAAEVSGRVITTFIVEKDGTLSNVKNIRDLGHGTGEEAVRVIKNGGKWKPGVQNGQSVRVQFTMPIVLNLTKDKQELSAF